MDSLDVVEVVMAFEDEFGMNIYFLAFTQYGKNISNSENVLKATSRRAFTCSKSTLETPEQYVKSVQS